MYAIGGIYVHCITQVQSNNENNVYNVKKLKEVENISIENVFKMSNTYLYSQQFWR